MNTDIADAIYTYVLFTDGRNFSKSFYFAGLGTKFIRDKKKKIKKKYLHAAERRRNRCVCFVRFEKEYFTYTHTCSALTSVHVYYKHIWDVFTASFWHYGFYIFSSTLKTKFQFDLHAKRSTLYEPDLLCVVRARVK